MATDPLREAIERALPCTCLSRIGKSCPQDYVDRTHAAIAPLLDTALLDTLSKALGREAALREERAELLAMLDADAMLISQAGRDLAAERERREALVVVADARLAYILEWADVIEHYAHSVPEEVLDRARRPYRDAALAANDGEPDGPKETPTYNGPQEAAHLMEQARRLK